MDNQNITYIPKKKSRKKIIIPAILVIIILLCWAGLTRAGYLENKLNIGFLEPILVAKPVIYLYPKQAQAINVKLNLEGYLTTTYPKYNNGWSVTAYPNGKIINHNDNKEYSYLFWEGIDNNAKYDLSSGFIVKGSESAEFLQSKLADLGLNPKEYNEFIVYWLPHMQDNEYNLIHFATKEEYDNRSVLNITPKPDSILRVFMVLKKVDSNTMVKPQELKPFTRNGFTVIEWGGANLR